MSNGKQAVIFDIGGVLVRCRWDAPACLPLMEKVGRNADVFARFTAEGMFSRLNSGEISPETFAAEAIGRFGLAMDAEGFRAAWTGIFEPMPGMAELFAEVSARVPVTLLSDTDPWHWARLRADFPHIAGVERPILSFEHRRVKPDPALYRAAAGAVGTAPGDCVFIDDRAPNVEGARRAGLRAVLFEDAGKTRTALEDFGIL